MDDYFIEVHVALMEITNSDKYFLSCLCYYVMYVRLMYGILYDCIIV